MLDIIENFGYVARQIKSLNGEPLYLFLDYDGTLTPIVNDHSKAIFPIEAEEVVSDLQENYDNVKVAIVSGRSIKELSEFVKIPDMLFAGNHGYTITYNSAKTPLLKVADKFLPSIDRFYERLKAIIETDSDKEKFENVLIEHKGQSVAIHYRMATNTNKEDLTKIIDKVKSEIDASETLENRFGKKVIEVMPSLKWNKGYAVRWMLENHFHAYAGKFDSEKQDKKIANSSEFKMTSVDEEHIAKKIKVEGESGKEKIDDDKSTKKNESDRPKGENSENMPFVIYIGDDVTDEDVFLEFRKNPFINGLGVKVTDSQCQKKEKPKLDMSTEEENCENENESYANFSIESPGKVVEFLKKLREFLAVSQH